MTKTGKNRLSQEKIIEYGLHIVASESVDAVSFRKLAKALDVTPMALYRYFKNKEELLGELLDAFILKADVLPHESQPWQQSMMDIGMNMYQALASQPSWVPVFRHIQLKPTALGVMQHCIDLLQNAGFDRQQALQGFLALIFCLLGAVTMQSDAVYMQHSLKTLIDGLEQQIDAA